jgi:glycosyltransferase involved in cell wall biosynthesis
LGLDVRLPYYTSGGIARYVRQLASRLPALAPDCEHVHFYHRRDQASYGAGARRAPCWTPAHHRAERLALGLEVLPYRLSLLHSPDFIPPAGGYGKSVITVHDLTFLRYPEFLTAESRRYYNDQIRWAVGHADAIAADSAATAVDLTSLLGVAPEKITVIHLGLDDAFRPASPESSAKDAIVLARHSLTPGYVLFVGTFEPRKNVGGLLRAYARLRAMDGATPSLVLVGRSGWLFNETLRLIDDLRLSDAVRRFEDLPEAALPAFYRGAAVVVLPSHYEGFGFPVLEAMGCGIPAVISNRASLPEIAGGAALEVEPDDIIALSEALGQVLSDAGLRRDLAARGLARAGGFTWESTAQATLALYRRVLAT